MVFPLLYILEARSSANPVYFRFKIEEIPKFDPLDSIKSYRNLYWLAHYFLDLFFRVFVSPEEPDQRWGKEWESFVGLIPRWINQSFAIFALEFNFFLQGVEELICFCNNIQSTLRTTAGRVDALFFDIIEFKRTWESGELLPIQWNINIEL